jgi:hypothetical protein
MMKIGRWNVGVFCCRCDGAGIEGVPPVLVGRDPLPLLPDPPDV